MSIANLRTVAGVVLLLVLTATESMAQLVWDEDLDKYSAILPLSLNDDVLRIRAKPPEGLSPLDINVDVGITGTVMTDRRGTSSTEQGEKVLSNLIHKDSVDVMFTDRVFSGYHTRNGDRIIEKHDFDCGINVKYQNKKKVAQLEIRVGYILPSGDVEGLTWAKLRRKQRLFGQAIARCEQYKRVLQDLDSERSSLASARGSNGVETMRINARLSGINRQIGRLSKYVSREEGFRRDLAAFTTIEEYLKTKVNGSQVYVHFHHDGKTLPVDIDDLKRSKIRPVRVFEANYPPIKKPDSKI